MKKRNLEKHLRKYGCILIKQGAKHEKWINPVNWIKTMVPRHSELNTYTGRAICAQLEIPMIVKK